MKKTNFITRIVNRPTNKNGTRIILLSAAMVELILIIMTQYFPEFFTPEIVMALTTLLLLIITYGASKSSAPNENEAVQFAGTVHPKGERPKTNQGITEHPPINRT